MKDPNGCTMLSRPCYKHPFSQWHQSSSFRAFAKSSTKGAAKSPPIRHTRVQRGNDGKCLPDPSAPSSSRAWEPACRTRKSCGQGVFSDVLLQHEVTAGPTKRNKSFKQILSYVYFNSTQGPGASTCHIWGACSTSRVLQMSLRTPSSSNKALTKCWAKSASRSKLIHQSQHVPLFFFLKKWTLHTLSFSGYPCVPDTSFTATSPDLSVSWRNFAFVEKK